MIDDILKEIWLAYILSADMEVAGNYDLNCSPAPGDKQEIFVLGAFTSSIFIQKLIVEIKHELKINGEEKQNYPLRFHSIVLEGFHSF